MIHGTAELEGKIIGGKYRIEAPLARGGMGSVWIARHVTLGKRVAVKFMDPSCASSAEGRARFEREATATAQLESAYVVRVEDSGVDDDTPYLVMELLQGEDLSTRLRRERRLGVAEIAPIIAQAARGLRCAHQAGLVHRDLKPANIYLAKSDGEQIVKILDFGVAKALGAAPLGESTTTGTMMGSPHYMSPEQARGFRSVDHRSDIWALGIIIYRALTGRLPFPGDEMGDVVVKICTDALVPPSTLVPGLGPEVDRFFTRALAKDPDARFQSTIELAEAFTAVASAPPIDAAIDGAMPSLAIVAASPPDVATPASAASAATAPSSVVPLAGTLVPSSQRVVAGSTPRPSRLVVAGGAVAIAVAATLVVAHFSGTSSRRDEAALSGDPIKTAAPSPAPSSLVTPGPTAIAAVTAAPHASASALPAPASATTGAARPSPAPRASSAKPREKALSWD
jgi:serine/threonine-protein kinase